ncbi:MAG: YlxM family DNA-binding protein [Clostridia bacterium]|nr:YlxM family DNA-binding protein [Clostridia bacterium]
MAKEAISVMEKNAMEKKVMLSWLLAFYGEMLTENQREMARLHWEEDFSLAEIASQFSVSRQSVHDTVNRTEKQLTALEEKLGLLSRFREMETGLRACQAALMKVRATEETEGHLNEARRWIDELLNQEEA